jgi:hypothetical protein
MAQQQRNDYRNDYYARAAGGETWHIYGPRGFLGAVEVPGDDLDDVLAAAQERGLVPAAVTVLEERI